MRLCSTGAAAAFLCPTLALRLGETAILAVLGGCKTQLAAAEKMLMTGLSHMDTKPPGATDDAMILPLIAEQAGVKISKEFYTAQERVRAKLSILPDLLFEQARYSEAALLYERTLPDLELILDETPGISGVCESCSFRGESMPDGLGVSDAGMLLQQLERLADVYRRLGASEKQSHALSRLATAREKVVAAGLDCNGATTTRVGTHWQSLLQICFCWWQCGCDWGNEHVDYLGNVHGGQVPTGGDGGDAGEIIAYFHRGHLMRTVHGILFDATESDVIAEIQPGSLSSSVIGLTPGCRVKSLNGLPMSAANFAAELNSNADQVWVFLPPTELLATKTSARKSTSFHQGQLATVVGLKGAPQHNGKLALLQRFDDPKQRWQVSVAGDGKMLLKPVNLDSGSVSAAMLAAGCRRAIADDDHLDAARALATAALRCELSSDAEVVAAVAAVTAAVDAAAAAEAERKRALRITVTGVGEDWPRWPYDARVDGGTGTGLHQWSNNLVQQNHQSQGSMQPQYTPQTWRMQRDRAYLARARELFVQRCAALPARTKFARLDRITAESQLRNRLAHKKRNSHLGSWDPFDTGAASVEEMALEMAMDNEVRADLTREFGPEECGGLGQCPAAAPGMHGMNGTTQARPGFEQSSMSEAAARLMGALQSDSGNGMEAGSQPDQNAETFAGLASSLGLNEVMAMVNGNDELRQALQRNGGT
jgi:hypothetical protein